MADLIFHGQFIDKTNLDGETGLTVTIDVYRTTISDASTSQVVTGGSCTETGGGIYRYRLASADLSLYHYVANMMTTSADVAQKHVACLGVVIPDDLVSSRLASASYTAPLDASGTRTAVGLASANLDTQLAGLPTDADVQASATAALVAYDPPTKAELDAADDAVLAAIAALPTDQDVRDAMMLAPTAGSPATGSVDKHLDDIQTKTDLIAAATLTVSSPVADDGDATVYAGDDYHSSDSRSLEWTSSDWPNLTGATITLYLRAPDGTTFNKAGSAPVAGVGSQTVRVELTAAETAALKDWPSPTTLRVRATLATSARVVTLVAGELTVVEDI